MKIILFLIFFLIGISSATYDEENADSSPSNNDGYGMDEERYSTNKQSPNLGQSPHQPVIEDQNKNFNRFPQTDSNIDQHFDDREQEFTSSIVNDEDSGATASDYEKHNQDQSATNQRSSANIEEADGKEFSQTNGDTGQEHNREYQSTHNNPNQAESILGTQQTSNDEPKEEEDKAPKEESSLDFSKVPLTAALGGTVDIDDDYTDIDEFDFGLDELDEEEDTSEIHSNEIPAADWITILKNYVEVIQEEGNSKRNTFKIRKAKELSKMEEELVERNLQDFTDDTEEEVDKKIKCSKLEFNILSHIQRLPIDKQRYIMDVDKDGIPDFDLVDITAGLKVGHESQTLSAISSDTAPIPNENANTKTNQGNKESPHFDKNEATTTGNKNNYETHSNQNESPDRK